jgi:hypothetical protein
VELKYNPENQISGIDSNIANAESIETTEELLAKRIERSNVIDIAAERGGSRKMRSVELVSLYTIAPTSYESGCHGYRYISK